MKKKLLAGILALALCSTNMLPQTIFAEEFTSGDPDVVSEEETPEIFTNEEQEAAGETDEELSVFSSEELPEFDDAPDEAVAATKNAQNGVIDLTDATKVTDGVYTITSIGDHRFTCSNEQTTTNRIVVDGTNTSEQDNINIYLDNVNIKTSVGPALQINNNVEATVTIYLTGKNKLTTTNQNSAGLEKNNTAHLTIDNSKNNTGELIAKGSDYGAGIGGGFGEHSGGKCMNITISGGSVEAKGVGISGGRAQKFRSDCFNITISGGSVNAQVGCTPHKKLDSSGSYNPKSPEVYLCVIPNRGTQLVTIDDNSWKPSNHKAVGSGNTNLYAWLTGEDHFVTVGSEDRCYIFKSDTFTFNQQGKHTITNNDFNFNPPTNLTYDGNTKTVTVSPKVSFKDMAKNITVKYFLEDKLINGLPVNAGTYTVKINVKEGEFYNSIDNLTDDNWKFTIEPAPITSDIQITSYSGTYDGGPHAVIYSVTGCPKGCTIKYSTDRKTWTDKCPTVKSVEDATNTSVYIQISKENYTTLTLGPQKASISPKDITINIDNLEKTYGTANPALTFKVSDQTPLVANDTIKSLGIKLKTTAETSSPVNSSGYPITLES